MRTTVDLDEDILRAAKDLARESSQSLGRVLSELARKGLQPSETQLAFKNGIPLLPSLPGAQPVTSEHVRDLLDMDE